MIVVTGGAGFIGSAFVWKLNQEGISDILIVDSTITELKKQNIKSLKYLSYLDKSDFIKKIKTNYQFTKKITAIFHLGACSSTTETNEAYLTENNTEYTKTLAKWAVTNNCYFQYASSAATYGMGEYGFSDTLEILDQLKPGNLYGLSKHKFDLWARDNNYFKKIVGLKFFNVFGPNEYHKKHMQSLICKSFDNLKHQGTVNLFKSHRNDYQDGEQKRDFIYIKDCIQVMWWLYQNPQITGLYNLGIGVANTWNNVAKAMFKALNLPVNIKYFDIPAEISDQYQYYTCADMHKLQKAGYNCAFTNLENSIKDYITEYLDKNKKNLGGK